MYVVILGVVPKLETIQPTPINTAMISRILQCLNNSL